MLRATSVSVTRMTSRLWSMTCVVAFRDPCPRRHERRHLGAALPEFDAAQALDEHRLVLTDWIIEKLHELVGRKRPDLCLRWRHSLPGSATGSPVRAIPVFRSPIPMTSRSSKLPPGTTKPPPIPRFRAVAAAADVIVTGDKHFLSLGLDLPGPSPPAASSTPTPGSAKIERSESPAESPADFGRTPLLQG